MEKIQSIASYTKEIFDKNLHSQIVNKHLDVEAWFRKQWIKYPAPFYSSIDLIFFFLATLVPSHGDSYGLNRLNL